MLNFTRNSKIPLKIRRQIGKFLRKKNHHIDFTLSVFGQNYTGTTTNHMDHKIYIYGCHESATIRLIRNRLINQRQQGQSPVYMDIGTNTGLHLMSVAPLCDKAFGFEPFDRVRTRAENHISANNIENVTIFPFGLSDKNEKLTYNQPSQSNLGNGFFDPTADLNGSQGDHKLSLEVRCGDDIVDEYHIKPTIIKIDVEGFETFVFKGLRKTITHFKPDIIFEYNQDTTRHDPQALLNIKHVLGHDYNLFGIHRSREYPKLSAVKDVNTHMKYENILATCDTDRDKLVQATEYR